jgi:hypothetical protein
MIVYLKDNIENRVKGTHTCSPVFNSEENKREENLPIDVSEFTYDLLTTYAHERSELNAKEIAKSVYKLVISEFNGK